MAFDSDAINDISARKLVGHETDSKVGESLEAADTKVEVAKLKVRLLLG